MPRIKTQMPRINAECGKLWKTVGPSDDDVFQSCRVAEMLARVARACACEKSNIPIAHFAPIVSRCNMVLTTFTAEISFRHVILKCFLSDFFAD